MLRGRDTKMPSAGSGRGGQTEALGSDRREPEKRKICLQARRGSRLWSV